MTPDFIGIGAQKCATTWVYSILNAHPALALAMPEGGDKDTRFFSYYYDRGFAWYEDQFNKLGENTVKGEFSTSYFTSREAPQRIAEYAPDIKLLVCLRNPIERAFSNHKHEVSLGRIKGEYRNFEKALQKNPMYLHQSLYHIHLSRWLEHFPPENILVVLVDDIEQKADRVVESIYRFLGVDPSFQPKFRHQQVHQSRVVSSSFLEISVTLLSSLIKRLGLGSIIGILRNMGIKSAIDKANSRTGSETFPPMEPATRDYLIEYFRDANDTLGKILERDLSFWNTYET